MRTVQVELDDTNAERLDALCRETGMPPGAVMAEALRHAAVPILVLESPSATDDAAMEAFAAEFRRMTADAHAAGKIVAAPLSEADVERWWTEGVRAAEAHLMDRTPPAWDADPGCPHADDTRARHWWSRGYSYVARLVRAMEDERAMRDAGVEVNAAAAAPLAMHGTHGHLKPIVDRLLRKDLDALKDAPAVPFPEAIRALAERVGATIHDVRPNDTGTGYLVDWSYPVLPALYELSATIRSEAFRPEPGDPRPIALVEPREMSFGVWLDFVEKAMGPEERRRIEEAVGWKGPTAPEDAATAFHAGELGVPYTRVTSFGTDRGLVSFGGEPLIRPSNAPIGAMWGILAHEGRPMATDPGSMWSREAVQALDGSTVPADPIGEAKVTVEERDGKLVAFAVLSGEDTPAAKRHLATGRRMSFSVGAKRLQEVAAGDFDGVDADALVDELRGGPGRFDALDDAPDLAALGYERPYRVRFGELFAPGWLADRPVLNVTWTDRDVRITARGLAFGELPDNADLLGVFTLDGFSLVFVGLELIGHDDGHARYTYRGLVKLKEPPKTRGSYSDLREAVGAAGPFIGAFRTPEEQQRLKDASRAEGECKIPPPGWRCTRTDVPHDGPCAAVPTFRELFAANNADGEAWLPDRPVDTGRRVTLLVRVGNEWPPMIAIPGDAIQTVASAKGQPAFAALVTVGQHVDDAVLRAWSVFAATMRERL